MPPSRYQSSLLKCPNCSARGAASWEQRHDEEASPLALVKVSGDFHVETGRTVPDSKVIVCSLCDQIYGIMPNR
jgi:hypothetical protein